MNSNKILMGAKAIFFDAGGTLFRPFPSVGHYYSQVAAKYGCMVSEEKVEAAFHRVWHDHDKMGNLKSHLTEKNEREFWRKVVSEVFKGFGTFSSFDDFFNELHDRFAQPDVWKFFPEAEEVLATLKEKGYTLGLVSNWDSRLVKLCAGLGLDRFLDFKVISVIFGAAKPDPRIFHEALRLAGVKADEVVHIGDSLEDDIHGACRAGIRSIWLDRSGRHENLAEHEREVTTVIRDLRELLSN